MKRAGQELAETLGGMGGDVMPPRRSRVRCQALSEYLGVPPGTIRSWVSRRSIPHIKIGAVLIFDLDVIDAWLAERVVPVAAPEKSTSAEPAGLRIVGDR